MRYTVFQTKPNWQQILAKVVNVSEPGDTIEVGTAEAATLARSALKQLGKEESVTVSVVIATTGPVSAKAFNEAMVALKERIANGEKFPACVEIDSMTGAVTSAGEEYTAKLIQGGVPNANGDVFPHDVVRGVFGAAPGKPLVEVDFPGAEIKGKFPTVEEVEAYQQKVKAYNEKIVDEIEAGVVGPVTRTTVKPTEAEIAAHQAAHPGTKTAAAWLNKGFGNFYRGLDNWGETGRWLSRDYTLELPYPNLGVTAKAPSGMITVHKLDDPEKKPVPFHLFSRPLLKQITEFAANPRKVLEDLEAAREAAKRSENPCEQLTKKELLPKVKNRFPDLKLAAEALNLTVEIAAEVEKTIGKDYPDDQKFVCQNCGHEYVYGVAKQLMAADPECGKDRVNYNPVSCCSVSCADTYRHRHGHNPRVGAEIKLSASEMCNLGRKDVAKDEVAPDVVVGTENEDRKPS